MGIFNSKLHLKLTNLVIYICGDNIENNDWSDYYKDKSLFLAILAHSFAKGKPRYSNGYFALKETCLQGECRCLVEFIVLAIAVEKNLWNKDSDEIFNIASNKKIISDIANRFMVSGIPKDVIFPQDLLSKIDA